MQSATEKLRDNLFDVLDGLRSGKVSPDAAHAASKISENIIKTVVVEIQAAELLGADKISSINGQTSDERRALKGGVVHRIEG
ncbi:hypothetical protein L1281_002520 [Neisseria sp. HSC-16F19]|nr:flagellar protein required for flagellar formation [Neisseria sp. HSC-16F19]MCP2041902.1 hypothetical protein [Neisseria sp. HSC-16F19]